MLGSDGRDYATLLAQAEERGREDGIQAARVWIQPRWEERATIQEKYRTVDQAFLDSLPDPEPMTALDIGEFPDGKKWVAAWERYCYAHTLAVATELIRLSRVED